MALSWGRSSGRGKASASANAPAGLSGKAHVGVRGPPWNDHEYPFHDRTITVSNCGRICIGRRKINLSTVFAGQNVGIKEVSDKVWLVSFMQYDLGFFDHETGRVTSAENPFGAKVLPMCPE